MPTSFDKYDKLGVKIKPEDIVMSNYSSVPKGKPATGKIPPPSSAMNPTSLIQQQP